MSATERRDADGWRAVHAALVQLARERAGLDFEEGRLLLAARRAELHRLLGYGSFAEYVERPLGYAPRLTHDKLRVAAALEGLPELARELREGGLSFSQVRELTRVATPETERAWAESARGCTSRQVEKLVSGCRPGTLPDSAREPALERHVLRFEVSGETLATFREAVAALRRAAGEHLDDDATLLLLARQVLGGPTDAGRASYQVELDVCEDCQRARQHADGDPVTVSSAVVAMARCDAQSLSTAHVGANAHAGADAGASAGAGANGRGDASVDAGAGAGANGRGDASASAGANGRGGRRTTVRAAQEVPPAIRRSVLRRDRHRCRVPGCSHATFVDIHHIEARARGGRHDPSNLLTLCGAHHRAAHQGTLVIAGNVNELVVCHADGTPYGALPSTTVASAQTRAFAALRGLGFGERDVRGALTHAARQLPPGADLEETLRHSLKLLTERAWMKAS